VTLAPLDAAKQQIVALSKPQPPSAKALDSRKQCGSGPKQLHDVKKRIHGFRMPRSELFGFQINKSGVTTIDRTGSTPYRRERRRTIMTNPQVLNIYQTYVEAWKPISDSQRQSILSEVFDENVEYLVPEYVGGTKEATEDMERFQKQYPGAHFEIENVSTHHEVALFKWVLILPDGKVTVKGHDCIRFSPAGKIANLLTFGPASPKS
jgi:hypothetical protein